MPVLCLYSNLNFKSLQQRTKRERLCKKIKRTNTTNNILAEDNTLILGKIGSN